MKYVCLFDIDGTLLSTGGAGQRAMEHALEAAFGITNHDHDIPAAGRTDRAITRDLLAHHGIEDTDEVRNRFLAAYLKQLPSALKDLDGRVLPGVVELLAAMAANGGVALGLLTGNYRAGATLKLRHYGLDHHFDFGGFGDEHLHRDDVARAALSEACRHLDRQYTPDHIWVIGDTPSDVQCARAIGAHAIAVATGIYSHAELEASEPDQLYENFQDPERFLAAVLS